MKKLFSLSLLFISLVAFTSSAMAVTPNWSGVSVPTQISVDAGGFTVYGDSFANFGTCTGINSSNQLYIPANHPQYQNIFATVLAAYTAKLPVQGYVTSCGSLGVNVVGATSALQLIIV